MSKPLWLKVIRNKANGQINLNPPMKKLPKELRDKLKHKSSSIKMLVNFKEVKLE
jgi:hypothetical protein|tara:strand:- start:1461 stop:1625 length:165 start_codon:yes stop_codon:yes gene_type:complete